VARVYTDAGAMKLATTAALGLLFDGPVWTIALPIYRTAAPAAERGLVGMGDFATDVGWWVTMTATGAIQAVVPHFTTNKTRLSSTVTALNAWTHLVVTNRSGALASSEISFYFDGKPEAGTSVSNGAGAVPVHTAFAFSVGPGPGTNAAANTTAPPANIGYVAMWNRWFTDAEALGLAMGLSPLRFREGLVEMWDFEDPIYEEGLVQGIPLIPTTVPTNAFVNPPRERATVLRPRTRARNRYSVPAGFVGDDDEFILPIQQRDDGVVLVFA
jgi:hypothetical protein